MLCQFSLGHRYHNSSLPKTSSSMENCTKFGQLILSKIIKIVANSCQILRLKCTKFDFGWGSAPDLPWGSSQRSPDLRGGGGRGNEKEGGAVARKGRGEERIGYERGNGCLLLNEGLVTPLPALSQNIAVMWNDIRKYRKTSNRSPRLLLEHFTSAPGLYWRPGFYLRSGFYLNIANLPF